MMVTVCRLLKNEHREMPFFILKSSHVKARRHEGGNAGRGERNEPRHWDETIRESSEKKIFSHAAPPLIPLRVFALSREIFSHITSFFKKAQAMGAGRA
ncbi:MAG: hypothetical protein LBI35_02505 [Burkholderiales bacterium]|jgi:hypothetical protein|nr:hypothetical protein [Burkholderiales bacterium]